MQRWRSCCPYIYQKFEKRYQNYTIRQLCQELHDFYKAKKINVLQKKMFLKKYFPSYFISPQEANWALVRGEGELVPLKEIEGRVALEAAVPYPPGVPCVQPGERWTEIVMDYIQDFVEGMNELPGFTPEIQGVYTERIQGKIEAKAFVLTREAEEKYGQQSSC